MNFNLIQIGSIGVTYLLVLFGIAYSVERGWIPRHFVRHPVTYILSLGVYASAWAFYGNIGMAHRIGYGYLAYYLGLSGAFILSPLLLRPILRITQTYQLGSLADLFAFRYRSRWAGALVTLLMMMAILPLLALQISAVSDSIHIVSRESSQFTLGFGFCVVMILFAILFGARHVSPREKHEGLVFAIAFESLFKLVTFSAIGIYAAFVVFEGPADMFSWFNDNQENLSELQISLTDGQWRTLLLIFFAASIVMPHMFHMGFTESLNGHALTRASWGVPVFLALMAVWVLPILWAGIELNYPTNPQYFTLGIGLATQSGVLAIVALTGGLAAASGLMIVTTLSVAAMCLNHLILPLYQPSARWNIYNWLLWTRRILIATIILLGYGFYITLAPGQPLANLGIVSFVATLHFLPGVVGVLFWPRANRKGFLLGLSVGITIWFLTMLLPLLAFNDIPLFNSIGWLFKLDEHNWHLAALGSLVANIIVFFIVSLITHPDTGEDSAAQACSVGNIIRPQRRELVSTSSEDFVESLSKPLGSHVAQREVTQALADLRLPSFEARPYALKRLRTRIEANLSGLMGPSVAQQIVDRYLPYKQEAPDHHNSEDLHFIESGLESYQVRLTGLAAELDSLRRFHRQTLQSLPLGVCSLGSDHEILMWNQAMEELTGISNTDVEGSVVDTVPEPWKTLIQNCITDHSVHTHKKSVEINGRPRWFNLHKSTNVMPNPAQNDGVVILVEDQTENQMLEDELVHSERLASIGRLAAGVAHEIGNPVTGIACLAQNLKHETDLKDVRESGEQILEQTHRITKIVQSLMNFAHQGNHTDHQEHEPVDLHQCVKEAIGLISLSSKGKEMDYQNQCKKDLFVVGDSQRLLQVFVNLISNAQDASPEGSTILVCSQYTDHTVVIEVIDEGEGIPAEQIEQVFEPFFTTKDPGEGTGLGLSLVYSIIEEHYGHIAIESPVNAETQTGTKFIITLPRFVAAPHTTSDNLYETVDTSS